jgi:hypothetical protein
MVKFGGGSIMVWGHISYFGVGNLVRVDGGVNAELYCKFFDEDPAPNEEYYRGDISNLFFQRDYDPINTLKKANEWLSGGEIEVLYWPT